MEGEYKPAYENRWYNIQKGSLSSR